MAYGCIDLTVEPNGFMVKALEAFVRRPAIQLRLHISKVIHKKIFWWLKWDLCSLNTCCHFPSMHSWNLWAVNLLGAFFHSTGGASFAPGWLGLQLDTEVHTDLFMERGLCSPTLWFAQLSARVCWVALNISLCCSGYSKSPPKLFWDGTSKKTTLYIKVGFLHEVNLSQMVLATCP